MRPVSSLVPGKMPRAAVSHKHISAELARCLEDEELDGFENILAAARETGYNLDQSYGKEVGVVDAIFG